MMVEQDDAKRFLYAATVDAVVSITAAAAACRQSINDWNQRDKNKKQNNKKS
jgi:hypothetical protein